MNKIPDFLNKKLTSPAWILGFVILFSIAYFIFAHEGFYWIDDYGYAKYAWELTNGTFSITQNTEFHPNNPLTHRVMIYGPVAILTAVFGLNIYAITLWPFICTLGCSAIIYLLYCSKDPVIAVAGMLLLGLYFHNLFLGSYLYSDNILMFFAFAAVAVLYRYRYQTSGKNVILYALLFVLANFAASLAKETIIYYLIFYIWLFATDLFRKKQITFWAWSFGFGVLVLLAYFGWYQIRTGNWMYRLYIIEQTNLRLQDGNYINASWGTIVNRLTIGPFLLFIGSGIMVPFVLALGSFRNLHFKDLLILKQPEYFWLLLSLLVIIQFWFGSTSISYYTPITLKPRMFSVAMPPLCMAAAYGLQRYFKGSRFLAALFALLFALSALLERSNMLAMYVPLTLYFAWNWWQMRKPEHKISYGPAILLLILVLSLRPLHFMRKPSLMSFQQQDKIIKTHLNEPAGRYLVIGDPWLHFMYDFHYRFEPNPHYEYRMYADEIPDRQQYEAVYLLVNRSSLSNPDMTKMHPVQEPQINELYPDKEVVAQDGKVTLYRLK